ncbi:NADH-FMN oxidoreductase RutF, flavin reductase (DIM6/NTAB) family [Amycolatopsis marina]|uniref:NADH-FMN oxidoreductase RutF, flavin reductase (DIM6/NTAB) family n=1 Tax=Amycolatopsis marina TaxID=490629 RepID=A0A1I0ZMQ4_9PSEU|nr:flavin reductase family protein [Amycolatopsis marina]SFB25473.1 NADH-FMN oxidoreductase RutF, flavin reductase (DIM6/NTAB) family [Amycolatopsis marina]
MTRTAAPGAGSSPRQSRLSEQSTLREVMSRFATGITVLTAGGENGHGMTANAFSSVSLEPPMVLCCVSRAARMHEAIVSAQSFAVSILGAGQREQARYFADWRRPRGLAQFDQVDWTPGPQTGAPLLAGSLAWLECRLARTYAGGDHSIFLGEVLSSSRGSSPEALLFFGGDYHQVA